MTLTAILPTLRASIPDPLAAASWPARTRASVTDVVVDGVSLHGLALLCGTPCVHTADGAEPFAVLVTTVTGTTTTHDGRRLLVLDAGPTEGSGAGLVGPGSATWAELRLLGRASVARLVPTVVCDPDKVPLAEVPMPADVATGDLLGVPCPGGVGRGPGR
ncbi:hypothetical protein GCM10010413_05410 [Promicromonospora sukumoe]|uniref:Uncharacterized protein n=1 Tax=Promicromonospora sukumoe TaxID=88382 RepID=A0A7W3J4N2_9MICO|nr:hypothetical protein [Promicromonospora sukumoe]MBA8806135.1 hypothetical protein [Promicromonospora sukumoe]